MKGKAVPGKCIICGFGAETGKNFICSNCGDPLKIILTCTKCYAKFDLTEADPQSLKAIFKQPITFGMAIATPWCEICTTTPEERKGAAGIYRVTPPAKA